MFITTAQRSHLTNHENFTNCKIIDHSINMNGYLIIKYVKGKFVREVKVSPEGRLELITSKLYNHER